VPGLHEAVPALASLPLLAAAVRGRLDEWGNSVYAGTADADGKVIDRLGELSDRRFLRGTTSRRLVVRGVYMSPDG
jgi:hypothetical protein